VKRLLALALVFCLFCTFAWAEDTSFVVVDDEDEETGASQTDQAAFEPLAWDVRVSPNLPDPNAYLPDQGGYHDASIDVAVQRFRYNGTLITAMYVTISDVSQFRAGFSSQNRPMAKIATLVSVMSKRYHAVCAVSGDWFADHDQGIVYRNGQCLRIRPHTSRDALIVDEAGDLHIITQPTRSKWDAYLETGTVIHAFCFGPALVIDSEVNPKAGSTTLKNAGKDKHIQRTAIGQMGPLSYVFVTCDGPENESGSGLTIAEMAELMHDLGCSQAYNLDGASSSTLVLNNVKINAAGSKKRPVGDCIWFATLIPNVE